MARRSSKKRIVFMGSPQFAVPSLERLAEDFDVAAIYSQPPKRQGRGMRLQKTAIHQEGERRGICVHCPSAFDDEAIENFKALKPDFLVVVAYGAILPQAVLDIPKSAPINGHASLLSRWRGAAPIQRAIEAGDKKTGITAMLMEGGLDTGAILKTQKTAIKEGDTAGGLHDRLSSLAAKVLVETIAEFDTLSPKTQPEKDVTWAGKITPQEARLDFKKTAAEIDRKTRAFSPFPGAWTEIETEGDKPMRLKIKAVKAVAPKETLASMHHTAGEFIGRDDDGNPLIACAEGAIALCHVQPPNKPPMSGRDFINGYGTPCLVLRSP